MPSRSPYDGQSRKLVLAFDVGTTYSGISYSICDPGAIPEIRGVTTFPAQENVGGDSKIPTIIYYDQQGAVRAVGAEALQESILEMVEEETWVKAEWFKLHLRPRSQIESHLAYDIPPLPPNKTVVDVFADFLRYLLQCAKAYIQESHGGGVSIWASTEKYGIEYVLSHPNGWEGVQQNKMRKAAILAGLIPENDAGHARIHFVTEGEACLHYCIGSGLTAETMRNGNGVLIVDAGGGTIDLSAYGQTSKSGSFSFEEISSPQCHFQGSVFVTNHARVFLEESLRNTRFSPDVELMTDIFDKTTKRKFRTIDEPAFIKFGTLKDTDQTLNIRHGQLRLPGTDVASFFEPAIRCIIQAIVEQRITARKPISTVFLVGGFGASTWLFSRLKTALEPLGLDFCRPDSFINKAVADGAVSFYLDHFVGVRVSKHAYGISCSKAYDPTNSEHKQRKASLIPSVAGCSRVPGAFDVILSKDVQVSETQEFRRSYFRSSPDLIGLEKIVTTIFYYRGPSKDPKWMDTDPDKYSVLCNVEADTSAFSKTLRPRTKKDGDTYYALEFEIILSFGLTELKAQICWKENAKERRGPAKIVYNQT